MWIKLLDFNLEDRRLINEKALMPCQVANKACVLCWKLIFRGFIPSMIDFSSKMQNIFQFNFEIK